MSAKPRRKREPVYRCPWCDWQGVSAAAQNAVGVRLRCPLCGSPVDLVREGAKK